MLKDDCRIRHKRQGKITQSSDALLKEGCGMSFYSRNVFPLENRGANLGLLIKCFKCFLLFQINDYVSDIRQAVAQNTMGEPEPDFPPPPPEIPDIIPEVSRMQVAGNDQCAKSNS